MKDGDKVSLLPGKIEDFQKHWISSGHDINDPKIKKWIDEDFNGHRYFLSHTQDKGYPLYFTGYTGDKDSAWISDEQDPKKDDLSWSVEVPIELVVALSAD